MRQLSLAELDAVSGGRAGWDSCDYNSEMGVNMPIEDHGAYAEAQAKAAAISLWASAQANAQLDGMAKSLGFSGFYGLQKQAAIEQQQTCLADPTFTSMMSSWNFTSEMNNLISLSKSSGYEYAINYYGNGQWSSPYTSKTADRVVFSTLDLFNLFYGWADAVVHTHFNAVAGLSPGSKGDIGMANRHNTPVVAVDFTQPDETQHYFYNPESKN